MCHSLIKLLTLVLIVNELGVFTITTTTTATTTTTTILLLSGLCLDNPGEPAPEGTYCHLLDFLVQNEDNASRCTNNLDGLPPHPD